MLQLKSNITGKIIEVNEIDVHWYAGHEEFKELNEKATETIKAEPKQEEATPELKKRGRPRKTH
jgi:hypothetical protein